MHTHILLVLKVSEMYAYMLKLEIRMYGVLGKKWKVP